MNKIKVLVLMSSFNGEKFIENQVNSIFNQENCDVFLKVHDDCSTDNTYKILLRLKDKYKNIEILRNTKQLGFSRNFLNLISNTNSLNFEYIALSDQDDIFYVNKFTKSIDQLISNNAVGISSSVKCFGSSSKILYQSNNITKYDYLFEGAGQGNTFIITKMFFKEFQYFVKNNIQKISSFYFHDWLIYLFCRSKNYNWYFYNEPLTYYRIHKDNVVGNKYSLRGIYSRLKKITNGWYLTQIYKANSISRIINPNIVNLKKLSLFSLYFLILFNGRRKISDRAILLFTFIISKK